MRTGKEKTFCMDDDKLNLAPSDLERGKGLYGGDLDRSPHPHRGITPYVSFRPVPEIRRLVESDEEAADQAAFLSKQPMEIEIGFGKGNFLRHRAARFPEKHFVGFEIHRSLCLWMAERIQRRGLTNLRLCFEDCRQSLPALLSEGSVDRAFVFFPDPWWKRRHVKRRLLSPPFLDLLYPYLAPHAVLSIKTDVMPYADYIEQLFAEDPRFLLRSELEAQIFDDFSPTEREAFCLREGIPFRTFCYQKL